MVTVKTESVKNYSLCPDLNAEQIKLQSVVLNKYELVMTPLPGCSETITYDIELTSKPVRAKFYPVPVKSREYFDEEVDTSLKLKIIQPSHSPCSSPVIMAKIRWYLLHDHRLQDTK